MRRYLLPVLGVAIVAFTFVYVLPRVADYGAVWRTLGSLAPSQLALLAAAMVANVITYAPPYYVAVPGLGFLRAFVISQVASAASYVAPGGAAATTALSYAMLRSWGFARRGLAVALAAIAVFNQIVLLAAPAVALLLLTLVGERNALLQTVAIAGLVLLVLPVSALVLALASRRVTVRVGDLAARFTSFALSLAKRPPVHWSGEAFGLFRTEALELLRGRALLLALATIAGHATVFLVLLATLRTLGVPATQVSGIECFAAWSLVRLLGSIPITPGGIGLVELGLTGALTQFGGDNAAVVAAVLLYRVLTLVPTIVLGALLGLTWRRGSRAEAAERGTSADQPKVNA
jgi:putative heme transporter